jgi:hypothetical protein
MGGAATLLRVGPGAPFGEVWDRAIAASRPGRSPVDDPHGAGAAGPPRVTPTPDVPAGEAR